MRRIAVLSLLTMAVMVLSACDSTKPAPEPTQVPEPTAQPAEPTAAPPEVAATQEAPTEEPPAASASTQVQITLADNTIVSSLMSFKAGVPYTFVINNHGRHEHNFNISPPVAVAGSIDDALASALLSVGDDQLPIGGGTSVEYTFPQGAVGMVLEFNCLIRRHYDDGMRLDITVTN